MLWSIKINPGFICLRPLEFPFYIKHPTVFPEPCSGLMKMKCYITAYALLPEIHYPFIVTQSKEQGNTAL